ncbi:ADP-ribosylation factor [Coprinopsis sp. MPI-PUGE-AT-0042]|nr:ADP-ribosylation factor [Coprinopsis sp. MPI-PUGE-AT-0042]
MTIASLINRFYPSAGSKVVITGSEWSGKTTLLYILKYDEIFRGTVTLGYNVENVAIPLPSQGKTLRLEAWDVGRGDDGNKQFLVGQLKWNYLPTAKAMVWMWDRSRDANQLKESAELLQTVLEHADDEMAESKTMRLLPILILANKSDLPNLPSLDVVRMAFSGAVQGSIAAIYPTSITKKEGLTEAFGWLSLALEIAATAKLDNPVAKTRMREPAPLPGLKPSLSGPAKRLDEWLHRTENDLPAQEFIEQFGAYNLSSWDHYTHIRFTYLILVAQGRQQGKDMIFEGLAKYLANSPRTDGTTFHFTLTYFWIQFVHLGIRNMPRDFVKYEASPQGDHQLTYPSSDDFFRFLLVNPHLTKEDLWAEYYTKEALTSKDAEERMVLPDRKPLPSLVVRDAIAAIGQKS